MVHTQRMFTMTSLQYSPCGIDAGWTLQRPPKMNISSSRAQAHQELLTHATGTNHREPDDHGDRGLVGELVDPFG
jgi:hypothetical protein